MQRLPMAEIKRHDNNEYLIPGYKLEHFESAVKEGKMGKVNSPEEIGEERKEDFCR